MNKLPELPTPSILAGEELTEEFGAYADWYEEDQMRAYGEQCWQAALSAPPSAPDVDPSLGSCAECGKTSNTNSMWALYCVDCAMQFVPALAIEPWAQLVADLCPEGIESACDECGGDSAECPPTCPYPRARKMLAELAATPGEPQAPTPDELDAKRYRLATKIGILVVNGWPVAPVGKAEWDSALDAAGVADSAMTREQEVKP